MLIEGAFTKLPEVLIGYDDDIYLYEAGITNLFSNAILLELNARNIDNPLSKIFFEKRYNPDINERCDIYANFEFIKDILSNYGYYSENWIEAKYFGNRDKRKGNETKSENAGKIAYDIYRLIKNTPKDKQGLYSLVLFDDNPKKYLAFARRNGNKRDWLESLQHAGIKEHKEFDFNLQNETETVKKVFNNENVHFSCRLRVSVFMPIDNLSGFYGLLIQILDYNIYEKGE